MGLTSNVQIRTLFYGVRGVFIHFIIHGYFNQKRIKINKLKYKEVKKNINDITNPICIFFTILKWITPFIKHTKKF